MLATVKLKYLSLPKYSSYSSIVILTFAGVIVKLVMSVSAVKLAPLSIVSSTL